MNKIVLMFCSTWFADCRQKFWGAAENVWETFWDWWLDRHNIPKGLRAL